RVRLPGRRRPLPGMRRRRDRPYRARSGARQSEPARGGRGRGARADKGVLDPPRSLHRASRCRRRDDPLPPVPRGGAPAMMDDAERRIIVGTAGHIDHGKTALVRALTGIETDRLEEEQRRGITIDLGFAHLDLPDGTRVGIVDVPGHEGFIRNMLAGATGIDVALLVVAADEGVMPQTREHVSILDLLGVRAGLVAVTKVDLVEQE